MGYMAPSTTNYGNLSSGIGQDVLSKMKTTSMWDPTGGNGSNGSWGFEGGEPTYNSDPNGNSMGTTYAPRYLAYHPGGQGPGEQYPYFDPETGEFKGYRTGGGIQSYLSGILSVAGAGAGFGALGAAGAAGDAGGFVGEGAASGVPAWDGALAGATPGTLATTAGGAVGAGGAVAGGGGSGGLGSLTSGTGGLATKVGLAGLTSGLGGGGGSNPGGGGGLGILGNASLGDLANLVGGAYGAGQQGDAAKKMLDWINGQQSNIQNLYSPGSPEFNSLWDQMSRTDAAAGRNSQYGPRAVDLAGKITQIKADAMARMAPGMALSYSKALNQDASKYAGITAPLGSLLSRAGSGATLGNLLQALGMGGGNGGVTPPNPYASNDTSFQDAIDSGQVQMPTDSWYTNPSNPNEGDVLDFINRWGSL